MLIGVDYLHLHVRRLEFAREALFGASSSLPAWYPRELLGQPFWSNIQSFPFIPTRLLLLFVEPALAFAIGVNLAAQLAALFGYAFCRGCGLAPVAAAAAGWTFACSGYFAARVLAGHLPLLEAYPALPLLLWLVDRALVPDEARPRLRLLALAGATTCVALAGHPQLPFYAIAAATLYALYRGRRRAPVVLGAITLGLGMAGFVWWPTLELIRRSTRTLALERPANDVFFPYERLGAFFAPWKDGWPAYVERLPAVPFPGNQAVFWDTVGYVGLAPLAAVGLLAVHGLAGRWSPAPPFRFVAALGAAALAAALPLAAPLLASLPGTILRSPARQIYLTEFALACSLGVALDLLLRAATGRRRRRLAALVAAVAGAQLLDLGAHDGPFVNTGPALARDPGLVARWRDELGAARVAMDVGYWTPLNRAVDDVGFFDSILLARPYRALLSLTGAPPRTNVQALDGSTLSARALTHTGVARVVTEKQRPDLRFLAAGEAGREYAVPRPAPRAAFVPHRHALFLDEEEIHARLRDPGFSLRDVILLPREAVAPPPPPPGGGPAGPVRIAYERPSSDEIVVHVESPESGFVRILEAWDPGWRALVDGAVAPVLRAEDFVMAIRVDPGTSVLRLRFATPGAAQGLAISAASAALLIPLVGLPRRSAAHADRSRAAAPPASAPDPDASRSVRTSASSRN
jgi:hypothetical protein